MGIVSFKQKTLLPQLDIIPLQTHSDWALIPGIAWGADSNTLYVVTHAPPPGLVNPEESPNFDLSAYSLESETEVRMITQTGMFAYPAASPARQIGAEQAYSVAYLQALAPTQSETSGYRLVVMDRDGSNRRALFPDEGSPGLEPQTPLWGPAALSDAEGDFVAVIYQGNLYLVDTATGTAHQVTGDGLMQKIDWK
jgi:resuscitation-promoting factor RpfB